MVEESLEKEWDPYPGYWVFGCCYCCWEEKFPNWNDEKFPIIDAWNVVCCLGGVVVQEEESFSKPWCEVLQEFLSTDRIKAEQVGGDERCPNGDARRGAVAAAACVISRTLSCPSWWWEISIQWLLGQNPHNRVRWKTGWNNRTRSKLPLLSPNALPCRSCFCVLFASF